MRRARPHNRHGKFRISTGDRLRSDEIPFSIMSRFRSLSMRPLPFSCALFTAVAACSLAAIAETPVVLAAKSPPSAAAVSAPAAPAVVLQAPGGPVAPSVAAASWVLVDTLSGQTLGAENPDERRDPASLTKLMTAYLAFGALRAKTITPSQMVQVSQQAWKAEGSRMFIEPRKAVTRRRAPARHDRAVGQRRVDRARRARRRAARRRSSRR